MVRFAEEKDLDRVNELRKFYQVVGFKEIRRWMEYEV